MRRTILAGCALALAAPAFAAAPEARNPMHCNAAFQVAYEIAKDALGNESALARELHGRLVWQALAAARFPATNASHAEAATLRRYFSIEPEAVLELAAACMKRQDANPDFREARLAKHARDGASSPLLSAGASVAQLRDAFIRGAAAD